jgi:acetylglutamate kinase
MKILVKIGGAQLEQDGARDALARSLQRAIAAGHQLVVVHGGGNQIRDLVRALRLPEQYHEGIRITDAKTADVVLQVLAGQVNKQLVHALESAGVRAAGLCGADGSSFHVQKDKEDRAVDLGYVGTVARIDTRLIDTLLDAGFTPVIATTAPLAVGEPDARDHFYNVNADLAAGPLAKALGADALLFLTDVQGVLDGDERRIERIDTRRCEGLREQGVIRGGMIPKVEAALAALAENPRALVKIAPAFGADAVLAALEPSAGTTFVEGT